MPGIFPRKGIGNHPEAELLALQSSFAVGDQRFEEIRSCLVKKTKVCPPGHVTDDVDSGLPHRGGHRGYLPKFVLAKRVPQQAFRTENIIPQKPQPDEGRECWLGAAYAIRRPTPRRYSSLIVSTE